MDRVPSQSHGVDDIATQRAVRAVELAANDALTRIATLEAQLAALQTKVDAYIETHP